MTVIIVCINIGDESQSICNDVRKATVILVLLMEIFDESDDDVKNDDDEEEEEEREEEFDEGEEGGVVKWHFQGLYLELAYLLLEQKKVAMVC